MKAQIECNFAKIKAQPAGKTTHILKSDGSFYVRGVSSQYYQIGFHTVGSGDTRLAFGDDVRNGVLFMHEGDCNEGQFMEIVVDQVD